MILDAETLELVNAIETLLEPAPTGEIKPELMESVLEISTDPCPDITVAGTQLRALRGQVIDTAAGKELAIGSAGTHPFAMWEDQRIVARPRYRDLISALRFVARQELIFGMHVHVGIDDPDKAIHVATGMRVHVPVLLGLSANSPFWRADRTGMASTRTPIFRAFPRVGMPPSYRDWEDYAERIALRDLAQQSDTECGIQQFRFPRDIRKWPGEFCNAGRIGHGHALPADCVGQRQQPALIM